MKLEIRLHGECAARFDSEADLLGWVAGEPTETMAIWRRMSVNAWAPETGIATHWLEGLLPEGLSREPFETRAARAGPDARAGRGVITLFWGNWDHEYAGAVEIAREDKPKERPGWRRIDEAELGALVADNARERAQRGRPRWPPADIWRKSALTGMRGKLGIRRTGTEWALATGSGLSTWIVKHEDRPELPGEAGTEAIMQRALACIGVRTARTESRMFGGMQCVLSERSDRNDWGGGVEAVHQEDFLQASGWPAQRKYEERVRGEPGYAELYRMLREHSADPEGEQAMLTRLIAACVMGANADMHRKNIGLLHEAGTQIPRVTLAPVYDFGSWAGLERTFAGRGEAQGKLALGVNGIDEPSRIGVKQWIAMAEQAGADTEGTVEEVKAVGRALPEAIAQARAEAQTTDENRDQGWVDRRVEATVRYAQRRARALEQEIESRARKGRSRGTTLMNARENKRTETGGTTLRKPEDDGYPQHDKWMDEAASEVWTRLGTLPGGLHLYGGAAFALYLGHRTPGGLDWATAEAPVTASGVQSLMADRGLECEVRTETGRVECTTTGKHMVNMSFAECGARIPAPAEPARPGPLGTPVAAPLDLVASKLRCIERRTEVRDYVDLAEAERRWPGIIRRAAERLHGGRPEGEKASQRAEPPEHIAAELSGEQLKALRRAGGTENTKEGRTR